MRILKLTILLAFLVLPLWSYGQSMGGYSDAANLGDIMRTSPSEMRKKTGKAYGTIGTPNAFEKFQFGNIYFNNKTIAKNIPINYDCFNNRVLYNKGEVDYILNSRSIDYLEFHLSEDSSVIFKQVFIQEGKKFVFMEMLYAEESKLYSHLYKSFVEADYTGPYNQDRRYDEYVNNRALYIELGNKELKRLKRKKKSILQLMEPYGGEIEMFIKKEKLDLKSEADLIRLVEYYDRVVKGG